MTLRLESQASRLRPKLFQLRKQLSARVFEQVTPQVRRFAGTETQARLAMRQDEGRELETLCISPPSAWLIDVVDSFCTFL
jgi:hypothetical protein